MDDCLPQVNGVCLQSWVIFLFFTTHKIFEPVTESYRDVNEKTPQEIRSSTKMIEELNESNVCVRTLELMKNTVSKRTYVFIFRQSPGKTYKTEKKRKFFCIW